MKQAKWFRSSMSTIAILLFSLFGYCQDDEFKLEKVKNNLFMIGDSVAGNVSFLVTEEGVLCVDAKYYPYQGERVVEMIRRVTDKPIKYLVYTHGHGDHIQGAQSFPPSTIVIAHQNTFKLIDKDGAASIERGRKVEFPRQLKTLEEKVEKLKKEGDPEWKEAERELELKRFQIKDYDRLELILPDITFDRRAEVHMGGHRIELIYLGSGHTEGDIVVNFLEEKVIHTGDLFGHPGEEEERLKILDVKNRLEKMEPAQIKAMAQSVENVANILGKILEMDFEIAIPGHGKISDKKGILIQKEFTRQLAKEILAGGAKR